LRCPRRDSHRPDARLRLERISLDGSRLRAHRAKQRRFRLQFEIDARRVAASHRCGSVDGFVTEHSRAQHDVAGRDAWDDESAVRVGNGAAPGADDCDARSQGRLGRRCVDHPAGDDADGGTRRLLAVQRRGQRHQSDERRGRVTRHQRSMNIPGVFDAGALEVEMRGPNQERMQLISPGRSMRADLIVK
jgi:hypothetical protein